MIRNPKTPHLKLHYLLLTRHLIPHRQILQIQTFPTRFLQDLS